MTKKCKIPKAVRNDVWDEYVGMAVGAAFCSVGCGRVFLQRDSWHCGHVIAEARGGTLSIDNLRPVCKKCNSGMGTTNMRDYAAKFYGGRSLVDAGSAAREVPRDHPQVQRVPRAKVIEPQVHAPDVVKIITEQPVAQTIQQNPKFRKCSYCGQGGPKKEFMLEDNKFMTNPVGNIICNRCFMTKHTGCEFRQSRAEGTREKPIVVEDESSDDSDNDEELKIAIKLSLMDINDTAEPTDWHRVNGRLVRK